MKKSLHFLRNQPVLILGLGESGLACAQFAAAHGAARIVVADTRANPPGLAVLQQTAAQCEIRSGAFSEELLHDISMLVISPGLSPQDPQVAKMLAAANKRNISIFSEIDWFALALAELSKHYNYLPKVIAITGTNGKTTVTRLTEHLAKTAGLQTIACGNISPAALNALNTALKQDSLPAVWILELSSFQLHYTHLLQADVATVLNVTQDHLDWHTDMQEYTKDKSRIFAQNTYRVLNRDDAFSLQMHPSPCPCTTFGTKPPQQAGDLGIVQDGGLKWLAQARAVEDIPRKKKEAAPTAVAIHRLMPADALPIRGSHNHANALAAIGLLLAIGLPMGTLLRGLRDYSGEPHRCQPVARIDEIDFIDDSKGTNVGATLAAINGLAEDQRKILLIAGGQGKGQDFTVLRQAVASWVKAIFLIGQDAELIAAALEDSDVKIASCHSLEEAVNQAYQAARAGDIVLLSPACASLDMFANYKERAERFIQAVNVLAEQKGLLL
ncbi:MAG: UDP-N-acetylmuramoyl-L-alanine--D-glutamate ligase [Burkholderiaceae bacterium]|nr:UDP-N-acetylmuramoyl-L-alanine--D-glutamate ligase [Burkholderiaceae bacterium]